MTSNRALRFAQLANLKGNKAMRPEILYFYRQNRAHQITVFPSMVVRYPGGREELTAASAAYGFHAYAAYMSAKSHVYFRKMLTADISAYEKQSRARAGK